MESPRAYIDGIAWWSPGLPDWDAAAAVIAGGAAPVVESRARPVPAMLPPAERRRAPDAVAVAIEVASRASAASGLDPAALPGVFATAHGELAITDYLCDILLREPLHTSPTKFHNSVHNAPAGYWCIASGCHAPYTTVSTAEFSCATGLLEALTQVAADGASVLYVAYDTEARGALATSVTSRGLLGAGLVLSPAQSARTIAEISWRVRPGALSAVTAPVSGIAAQVGDNAMAPCLPLFEAIARRTGTVTLALTTSCLLELRLAETA